MVVTAQFIPADSAYIVTHYNKEEHLIPMRDGKRLFTVVYVPRNDQVKHPVLLTRTPYSCGPYGKNEFRALWKTNHGLYAMKDYILVFQDVRGRFMSEGAFVDVRPYLPAKTGTETDEASDTYDTIEWLTHHIKSNNGRVGVFGISYPGFYSTMAALSSHPALKAVSPQAPVTDWFMGDDFHHNGAFMLMDAFEFYSGFGVPRPAPVTNYNPGFQRQEPDAYRFYLQTGPLPSFNRLYLGDSIAFWNDLMKHPVYDDWWKKRNPRNYMSGLKPAMLVVGGTFDAEDCFGAWNLYRAIENGNSAAFPGNIVMGPWFHGAWGGRSDGSGLGDIRFGSQTSQWYQQHIEMPFFEHHLNDGPSPDLAEATVFFSGENRWRTFSQWPAQQIQTKKLYFHPSGNLSFDVPSASRTKPSFTSYISDPAQPVPFEGQEPITHRSREYMLNDQRFASERKDVLTFRTGILAETITLGGPLYADVMLSTSTTDVDLVVKLIDEFPADVSTRPSGADTLYRDNAKMNGYQMLVRGEVMRGKFRNSFESPEAFTPGKPARVRFYLPDVAHTFQKGHRLMIQVQSSWFPLVDRNPQTFTDIYQAKAEDFRKAEIRLYHSAAIQSFVELPVMN